VLGRPTIATNPARKGELIRAFSHHRAVEPIP
jgi:hypothetical protein